MYIINNLYKKPTTFYRVVADIDQLKYFYDNVFSPLQNGESYFAALSSRAKKLSKEERIKFGAKRAEMFHTEILKKRKEEITFEDFLSFIYKFETNRYAYLTDNKVPYPDKSLVLYFYLNPCSELKVAQDTLNYILSVNNEIINSISKNSSVGVNESINKISTVQSHIKSCHAQNPSRKIYVDFDLDAMPNLDVASDTLDIKLLKDITKEYFGNDGYFFIRTAGGVHIVVKKEKLNFNPNDYIQEVATKIVVAEFKLNDNCMIPLPGTYQYGQEVRILDQK